MHTHIELALSAFFKAHLQCHLVLITARIALNYPSQFELWVPLRSTTFCCSFLNSELNNLTEFIEHLLCTLSVSDPKNTDMHKNCSLFTWSMLSKLYQYSLSTTGLPLHDRSLKSVVNGKKPLSSGNPQFTIIIRHSPHLVLPCNYGQLCCMLGPITRWFLC